MPLHHGVIMRTYQTLLQPGTEEGEIKIGPGFMRSLSVRTRPCENSNLKLIIRGP
jgi:hypothetical protein